MDSDGAVGVEDFLIWYFNHYLLGDTSRDVNEDSILDNNDVDIVVACAVSGGTAPGCVTTSYSRSIYYAHNDHLGTPHVLTDEAGLIVWSATYDPFGEATVNDDQDNDGNAVSLNLRFPGQYYDAETRFYYNYFRDYDPAAGRYLSSDPIGLKGGINTYTYVDNNPIDYIDPIGLFKFCSRGLGNSPFQINIYPDSFNLDAKHEQGFYEDGSGDNIGYFPDGVKPDNPSNHGRYTCENKSYDDVIMRKAEKNIHHNFPASRYDLLFYNCQDYTDALRNEYNRIKRQ